MALDCATRWCFPSRKKNRGTAAATEHASHQASHPRPLRKATTPAMPSLFWSEAVASEILVFFILGPLLLRKIGPGQCAALAATASVLRWAVVAQSVTIAALGATQLLHGLTFSLMHLSCMQVIANGVPEEISATAQTIYGTLCLGVASATLTFSGELYDAFGAHAFWLMLGLCLLAVPLAFRLGRPMTVPAG